MTRKRVYVAGNFSSDNVITILDNMRRGIRVSVELMLMGFAPFCPWLDYQFQLMLRNNEYLKVEDYYEYSMSWLEVSNAIFVLPNSENSVGTQQEITRAKELNIPIFCDKEALWQTLKGE